MSDIDPTRLNVLVETTCIYGLRLMPHDLSQGERKAMEKELRQVLRSQKGVPIEILVQAIRHGMPRVWPFTEGRRFDAVDVKRNITKAKGEAGTLRQAGAIPVSSKEAQRRFDKLREEHGE